MGGCECLYIAHLLQQQVSAEEAVVFSALPKGPGLGLLNARTAGPRFAACGVYISLLGF